MSGEKEEELVLHQSRFTIAVCASFVLFQPSLAKADILNDRATYLPFVKEEARKAGLPFDIADAVMAIESGYDQTKIGGVGEVGLMQVRPTTASMLGFTGSPVDLAVPETNIHYGVIYLAEAWRQANGDLCRALMKYRAGHGETVMTSLSLRYCVRAQAHLAAVGSKYASDYPAAISANYSGIDTDVLARAPLKPNNRLRGAAFWAIHDARIKAISTRIERHWRRLATR